VTAQTTDLLDALRRHGVSDVDAGALARALYSSDASLYRVPPMAVVRPRHPDEVHATVAACRELGVPVTARGAGTSIAGNAVGPGVVLDLSRHLDRVVSVDAEAGRAVVEPGVIQAGLQAAVRSAGLRFGPDPSTHNRCTLGGMIGNNSCGSRALAYGRTSDNVVGLDVLTAAGEVLQLSAGASSPLLDRLRAVVDANLAVLRTEFGRFPRQGSGYALEHLLPERGFDVAKALVGSEGTLGIVLGATVRLVRDAPYRGLLVLGYPDMATAADAVPAVLPHGPTACEGLDSRIVDGLRRRPGSVVPALPDGLGWLFVEFAADSPVEVADRAEKVVRDAGALDSLLVTDPLDYALLWRIREDGAGLAARTPDGHPAHAGFEDAAVPPEHLGEYLRRFDALLAAHGVTGMPYGHFGDGCVHIRIDFPLSWGSGTGRFRAFLEEAAALVAEYGGSISGEHGDGRARSELLPYMFSPAAVDLMGTVKGLFDPADLLNPGVIVRPRPVDADLRLVGAPRRREGLALAYRNDGGDFTQAVHRCTGVGKCRADFSAVGGVMCPSYLATRDEKDTTRGRARVLQEMVNAEGVVAGWRAPEVHEALDLCLSCKGCSRDCPTGVDMASYKAEVLHQSYRRRVRPRSHYTLGWLPRWARVASLAPGLVNGVLRTLPGVARWGAGMDRRRGIPTFAAQTFDRWWLGRPVVRGGGSPVVLWVDTFTNHFAPEVGIAAVGVLEAAGYEVIVPPERLCCGLTWISTGQLDAARRILGRTVTALAPYAAQGVPIVGLEPSCTAALRSESLELLGSTGAGRGPAGAADAVSDAVAEGAVPESVPEGAVPDEVVASRAGEDIADHASSTAAAASSSVATSSMATSSLAASAEAVAAATRTLAELLLATDGWQPPRLDGMRVVAQPHCHHHAVMGWAADAELLAVAGAEVTRVGGCCGLAGNWGVERGHHDVSVAIAEHALLPAVRADSEATVLADGFSCRTQLDDLIGRHGVHLAQLLAGS
jgi:FAD/FMN-containing dehydrogenase/Fe-S oxidoreductase